MGKITHRDINPILQKFRNFLLGRQHQTPLRFADIIVTRSPPPPQLPDGPAHKLSDNCYCTRDPRSLVQPPLAVAGSQLKLAGAAAQGEVAAKRRVPTPGVVFKWD